MDTDETRMEICESDLCSIRVNPWLSNFLFFFGSGYAGPCFICGQGLGSTAGHARQAATSFRCWHPSMTGRAFVIRLATQIVNSPHYCAICPFAPGVPDPHCRQGENDL